jgi:hypothetical protein
MNGLVTQSHRQEGSIPEFNRLPPKHKKTNAQEKQKNLITLQKNKDQCLDTKLHSKADRGADEESTSRSMTRRQQRYANEGELV